MGYVINLGTGGHRCHTASSFETLSEYGITLYEKKSKQLDIGKNCVQILTCDEINGLFRSERTY